jgi:hypothetical protein
MSGAVCGRAIPGERRRTISLNRANRHSCIVLSMFEVIEQPCLGFRLPGALRETGCIGSAMLMACLCAYRHQQARLALADKERTWSIYTRSLFRVAHCSNGIWLLLGLSAHVSHALIECRRHACQQSTWAAIVANRSFRLPLITVCRYFQDLVISEWILSKMFHVLCHLSPIKSGSGCLRAALPGPIPFVAVLGGSHAFTSTRQDITGSLACGPCAAGRRCPRSFYLGRTRPAA